MMKTHSLIETDGAAVSSIPNPTTGSLYFHVPFCNRKCDYCHFFVLPNQDRFKEQYLQALRLEWALRSPTFSPVSIYFGGGTPSLLSPLTIAEILSWTGLAEEITLEVNPESMTYEGLLAFKQVGINRISMGVQSFDDSLLTTLSRQHSAQKAKEAIILAASLFDNISIDLMYDLPSQTLLQWQTTLEEAILLPISHLSLYNLTIEPHTAFFKRRFHFPNEEESAQMYHMAQAILSTKLKQYEISAFGRPSIHNTGYWTGRPFLGFGPSAFSYFGGKRFRNIAHLGKYATLLKSGKLPCDFEEELSDAAKAREALVLRLRLLEGTEEWDQSAEIEKLIEDGFLEVRSSHLCLTSKGILFYDLVATELI